MNSKLCTCEKDRQITCIIHPHRDSSRSPVGYVAMPKALTAENGAKGLLIGEFSVEADLTCSACYFGIPKDDCEVCGGEVEYRQFFPIDWTTIKAIYAKAVEHLAT